MAIVKMKRLRLFAIKSQRDELIRKLTLLGCVEVAEPAKEEFGEDLARESGELIKYREWFRDLTLALGHLDRYSSTKDGMFAPRPEFKNSAITDNSGEASRVLLAERIIELDDKIKRIMAEEVNQGNVIESLKPWLAMDIPLDYKGTKSTGVMFGGVPAIVNIGELKSAVRNVTEEAHVIEVSSDNEQHCLAVLFHETHKDALLETLRTFWFSQMANSGMTGTARENSDQAEAKLRELKKEKEMLSEMIAAEKPRRDELKLYIDHMSICIAEQEATERLIGTQSTIILEGWLPKSEEQKLEKVLSEFDCAWETRDPTDEETEQVPVELKNNSMTSSMNILTNMYSLPSYKGVDPNPLMLPFFPLYFGAMFADIGYGLLLLFGGIFLRSKGQGATYKNFGLLGIQCGLMATIFGAITGGFFGNALTVIAEMAGAEFALPYLIDPLTDSMTILVIAIALGVIQMFVGVIVNGYMLSRDGKKGDAFWAVAPVFAVFGGIGLGAVGITWIVAIVGVVMVIYAEGRSSGTIGGLIGGGLYGLYNFASGWFGDILSYSRLMALMLAGSVVAQVFNTLGAMAGPIGFVFVFIIGHGLNIALNLIGCFVHSLRLQYLEYFGKFYRDGGKAFSPLAVKTNYVDIIKED